MSYSLIGQILGTFGTTISEMEFHFVSGKEWQFFVKGLKLKTTIRSSIGSGPFFEMLRFFYMTSPAQLGMRRALLNGSLLSS